uniref:Uncharacterized protein n=1 Tax=Romanomermis culicivorax TaxID=13658 RepID=A0A915JRB6_ROMCU
MKNKDEKYLKNKNKKNILDRQRRRPKAQAPACNQQASENPLRVLFKDSSHPSLLEKIPSSPRTEILMPLTVTKIASPLNGKSAVNIVNILLRKLFGK